MASGGTRHTRNKAPTALTYVGWSCVSVGMLIELPGSHVIHLDEGDAAAAPLSLRLVHREEGLEEQVDNALTDWLRIDGQTSQQVVHVAHIPKLGSGT